MIKKQIQTANLSSVLLQLIDLKCPYYGFLKITCHAVFNTALSRAGRYGQNLYHNIFLNFGQYDIIPISIWTLKKTFIKTAKNAHNRCLYLQTYEKWICQV